MMEIIDSFRYMDDRTPLKPTTPSWPRTEAMMDSGCAGSGCAGSVSTACASSVFFCDHLNDR